jgi:hypothetical protein|tara:strand:+ start:199 stop:405 length:207 start_codon:yes stop_codon:yes gene_type:complete
MNLTFLSKTDKELHDMLNHSRVSNREVQKEIKRRQSCGYSDGTIFNSAKAVVERESRVGTVTIVGARR